MSVGNQHAKEWNHLHRVLGVVGWKQTTPKDVGGLRLRFERRDEHPDMWCELPVGMDPLVMTETILRCAWANAGNEA